jgi:hypothetical protein
MELSYEVSEDELGSAAAVSKTTLQTMDDMRTGWA